MEFRLPCILVSIFTCLVYMVRGDNPLATDNHHAQIKPSPYVDPRPVPIHLTELQGTWYTQVYLPPTTWKGSRVFKSIEHHIIPRRGYITTIDHWRHEVCVAVENHLHFSRHPGTYKLEDNIGDVISGDYVVAWMEPDCHVIWGCVKRDVMSNRCSDYWVSARTRKRFPDKVTIDKIVNTLVGMGIVDFKLVDHSMSC